MTQRSFEAASQNWKCGASLGLPISVRDGEEEDILVKAGFAGDEKRDIRFACKGFLAFDSANAGVGASYALPFAKVIDGRLMVDEGSIKTARADLAKASLPADIARKADAVLKHYEAKLATKDRSSPASGLRQKGIYSVSDLASVLAQLRWVQADAAWEAEYEDDSSQVPGMLFTAMQQLGEALIAMTQEEVAELLASAGGAKAFMAKIKEFRVKAGRTFSAENEKCIKSACEQIKSGHDMLIGMMPAEEESAAEEDKSAKEARAKAAAKRAREIEVLRLKAA